jgi:hypothetical protein
VIAKPLPNGSKQNAIPSPVVLFSNQTWLGTPGKSLKKGGLSGKTSIKGYFPLPSLTAGVQNRFSMA